jgi:hypothetical protein
VTARQRLAAGQDQVDLGVVSALDPDHRGPGAPLPITSSRMGHLWDALSRGYEVLGFDRATWGRAVPAAGPGAHHRADQQAGQPARAGRDRDRAVLESHAAAPATSRREGVLAPGTDQGVRPALGVGGGEPGARRRLDAALRDRHGDRSGESGSSTERRVEPQITIDLLTDAAGFPLMIDAFQGNTAESTTMLPTIAALIVAHQLPNVTIAADAGMVSATNQRVIEAPRIVVHPRRQDPRRLLRRLRRQDLARGPPAARTFPPGISSPGAGRPAPPTSGGTQSSTTSTGRPSPAHASRSASRSQGGREGRGRQASGRCTIP